MATSPPEQSLTENNEISTNILEELAESLQNNAKNPADAHTEPCVSFPVENEDFESVNLDADGEDEDEEDGSDQTDDRPKRKKLKKKKKQTRLFNESSDTSSDEDGTLSRKCRQRIDPSDMTWPLWVWYYIVAVSSGALKAAEYLGEKLAAFFGITTPKYQYIIDEYYRLKAQEKEEEEAEQREQEYVEKMEAEQLARLEGGEPSEEVIPKENGKVVEAATTEPNTIPEVIVPEMVQVVPT